MAARSSHALVLCFLLTGCASSSPTTFTYWGWPTEYYRIEPPHEGNRPQVVFGGDSFALAEFCDADSAFHCFKAHRLWFAVPRDLGAAQEQWTHDNILYQVLERDLQVSVLGTSLTDVIRIRSPHYSLEEHFFEWLYSPSIGLVAFTLMDSHGASIWVGHWLQGERGFGAQ